MPVDYPPIPYGDADFRRVRLTGSLYVDKTRFLRLLEGARFAVLIRPRRFGKTCWVSLLENYYDRRWKDEFETVFGGTDIGREPTDERHRYVVLRFNFSALKSALETLEAEFESYCHTMIRRASRRHPDLFSDRVERDILAPPSASGKLNELFVYAGDHDIPLYVMVDEYDNFANTVLAQHGAEAYRSFTHGGGFYRDFFATLKAGAEQSGGGLERLFITGVSPITLDDVTSGFNIGENLSLDPDFNEMLGFTEAEVRGLLEDYSARGVFAQDVDETLDTMRNWYDGYRFFEEAETSVYNTDMVLYFLKKSIPNRSGPRNLIDENAKVDYLKLQHLLVIEKKLDRKLNGNFDLLRRIAGEERTKCDLQSSFPLERLTERENFLSLMHYFGLLSIHGMEDGQTTLVIPNQTVKRLLYEYLRDGYQDVDVFQVDVHHYRGLVARMANEGEWRPVFEFLCGQIATQTSIHDFIQGESFVKGFLAAYLNMTDFYVFRSEVELGKGYADIALEPMTNRFPHLRWGYLIELKYLERRESADAGRLDAAVDAAREQLRQYLADERLVRQFPEVRFIGLAVVFHGWEIARCEAVEAKPRSADGESSP